MHSPDRFIASCISWDDFWQQTKKLTSDAAKGAVFERLTQLYLQTVPEYRTELQHVWLLREVSADVRRRLNLPGPDEGIDLIARTRRGEYWAIQTKFRSQRDKPLKRRELGTFTSLTFNTCNNVEQRDQVTAGAVGEDRTTVTAVGCGYEPAAGSHGETLLTHDPHSPLVVHYKPIPAKLSSDPPVAIAGVLGADFPYFLNDFCLPPARHST
jgi:hypothetical protein